MFLSLVLILIWIFFTKPISGDGDFFHHISSGKYILENFQLPKVDVFTHTARGLPWVSYAWGMGVVYHLIYQSLGALGISLLHSFLAVLTFFLLYLLLRGYQINTKVALLTIVLVASIVSLRWPNRPEILTYPLILAVLLIDLYRIKYQRLIFLYPLIFLFWANFYGSSVILGLAILILLALKHLITTKVKLTKAIIIYFITILVSFIASFINGYGFKTLFYFQLYIPGVALYEGEWAGIKKIFDSAPPEYLLSFQYYTLAFFIYLALLLPVLILSFKRIRSYYFLLILSTVIILPFFAARQIPLAVILSSPLLAVLINSQKRLRKYLIAGVLSITFILSIISFWIQAPGLGQNNEAFPNYLIDFIKNNRLSGRALNSQQLGGFLTYRLYPKVLTYQDTRDDLFINTSIYTDYQQALASKTNLFPLIGKYNIDFIVSDISDGAFYQPLFYSEEWSPVLLSDHYLIAVPATVAKDKQLPVLDAVDPFSQNGIKTGKEKEAVKQYQAMLQIAPDSFNNQIRLAHAQLAEGDLDEAIKTAQDLPIGFNPKSPIFTQDRDYLLARIYFKKRDCERFKYYLDKASQTNSQKLIFSPLTLLNEQIYKGYAFYFLSCQKDLDQAKKYLNKYLSSSLTPLERLATEKEFNELVEKQK